MPKKRKAIRRRAKSAANRSDSEAAGTSRKTAQPNKSEQVIATDENRTRVAYAVALGFTLEEIAALVAPPDGITVERLKKEFPRELKAGAARIQLLATQRLYALATDEKVKPRTALEAQMAWLERNDPTRWAKKKSPS